MIKKKFKKCALSLILYSSFLTAHEVHIWDGNTYYENSESQKQTAEYVLEKFRFNGNEKILDLGCGDGKITAQLSRSVQHGLIVGVDPSDSMIKFAQERFSTQLYPNLYFYKGDATSLRYQNNFDVICSFTALQWVSDHEKALEGMHRALKHSGSLALSMPLGLPLSLEQALDEVKAQEKWRAYFPKDFEPGFNFVTLAEYRQLLQKTGFSIDLIEKRPQKNVFKDKKAFIGFLSQWFPYLRPIPEKMRDEFINQIVDRYCELEEIDSEESLYFLPYHLTVIAHKK